MNLPIVVSDSGSGGYSWPYNEGFKDGARAWFLGSADRNFNR